MEAPTIMGNYALEKPSEEWDNLVEIFKSCRTVKRGGRVLHCPRCNEYRVLYNSCNKRGCPVCSKKNQIQWKKKTNKKLLKKGHYHLIVNTPARMSLYWLGFPRRFITAFFKTIRESLNEYQEEIGLKLGIIMVFQSHGKGMSYKPHMHCIITRGGLNKEGKWKENGSINYTRIMRGLKQRTTENIKKELSNDEKALFTELESTQDEKGWGYEVRYHEKSGENIVNYLSRTVHGMVYSPEELTQDVENGKIIIEQKHMGKMEKTSLSYAVFTERSKNHIPPLGSVVIRHYGLYSNRNKDRLERLRERIEEDYKKEGEEVIEEYEEECPVCHSVMKVIEIFSYREHSGILRKYCEDYRGPPGHNEVLK